jgi:hypothetical protein
MDFGAQQALGELIRPNLASSWNMTHSGWLLASATAFASAALCAKPLF